MNPTLSFDLGTTYFKACVFDEQGGLVAVARVPTPFDRPHPGWAEMAPDAFLQSLGQLAHQLRTEASGVFARIGRVSFATQANSFLLLDHEDQPLTPIILWIDKRAAGFAPAREAIEALQGQTGFHQETGLPAASPLAMPAKLVWIQRQQPDVWNRARRVCTISDYFTRWLTGMELTEAGAAALTGLVDIHEMRWRASAVDRVGLSDLALPRIVRAGTEAGPIRAEAASTLGLPSDARLGIGCLDQYAGAVGVGNLVPGGVSETTGTVLATVALAEGFEPVLAERGVIQGPTFRPGWYYRMVTSMVSANLLEAYRQAEVPDWSHDQLSAAAGTLDDDADLPTLDAPGSEARGGPIFAGVQPHHTAAHHIRAIMVGVAETLAEQMTRISPHRRPAEIRCAGGAARSMPWLQIKADTLGIPAVAPIREEPTSYGGARIGNKDYTPRSEPVVRVVPRSQTGGHCSSVN